MSQMRLVCVAKLCGHGSQIDIWMRSDALGSLLQSATALPASAIPLASAGPS